MTASRTRARLALLQRRRWNTQLHAFAPGWRVHNRCRASRIQHH